MFPSRGCVWLSEQGAHERGEAVDLPALDEILELLTPLDVVLRFVLESRDRLAHDISEQVDQACPRLHLGSVCWEGEAVLGYLEQCHAQAPHVRRNGVALACDALWSHVVGRADERVGGTACARFAADAEVAEFDRAVAAEKDVAWLDVAMDDAMAMKVCEPVENPRGYFP